MAGTVLASPWILNLVPQMLEVTSTSLTSCLRKRKESVMAWVFSGSDWPLPPAVCPHRPVHPGYRDRCLPRHQKRSADRPPDGVSLDALASCEECVGSQTVISPRSHCLMSRCAHCSPWWWTGWSPRSSWPRRSIESTRGNLPKEFILNSIVFL